MAKSREAFRTISEVAEWLDTPAHVLRFWESRFSQVKPVKRAGGRRYYRPSDMLLLGGIKRLLHEDGITIKGVQKILLEKGVKHVVALSHPLTDPSLEEAQAPAAAPPVEPAAPVVAPTPQQPISEPEAPSDDGLSMTEITPVDPEPTPETPPQVLRGHPDRPSPAAATANADQENISALYSRLQNLRNRMQKQI